MQDVIWLREEYRQHESLVQEREQKETELWLSVAETICFTLADVRKMLFRSLRFEDARDLQNFLQELPSNRGKKIEMPDCRATVTIRKPGEPPPWKKLKNSETQTEKPPA